MSGRFARRAGFELGANPLAARLEALRGSPDAIDLTDSNPTRAGLASIERLARATLERVAADPRATRYEPSPRGRRESREAVAAYYAARGVSVDAERIVLTAGTSEGYAHLFRLLADPGDAVLVPRPSYPLFGLLAELEGVSALSYPLVPSSESPGAWRIDRDALVDALEPRVRAILLVHPNNPTGSFVGADELRWLAALASERGMSLVCDEVFLDYATDDARGETSALAHPGQALVFVLSGISKVAGLPQAKLGWIACAGECSDEALARLEVIADAYLSIPETGQLSLPHWLAGAHEVQREIRARVEQNRALLEHALGAGARARALPAQGGWYALAALEDADEDACALSLAERGVIAQPGWFYDLDGAHLVLSLLAPPERFERGVARLVAALAGGAKSA